jgi:PAS domain S-box-containing protein
LIQKQLEAEAELRQSESTLRGITSSLGEGVLVMDHEGLLRFMNPEAERLLGWRADELVGREVHDLLHLHADGTPLPADKCLTFNVLATGKRGSCEDDLYKRKDGTAFPVACVSAPILRDGKVVAAVIAFQDISERKRAGAEREKLIAELQEALEKITTLKGLLPICAACKKIRDDRGYWQQIEVYMRNHTDVEFSHGLCPECAKRLYPEFFPDPGREDAPRQTAIDEG